MVDGGIWMTGEVADGEFLVAGGDGAVLFESVAATLDGVAVSVDLTVERRWSPACTAAIAAVSCLICRDRDRGGDATLAKVGAVGGRGIRLVRQYPVRTHACPAATDARYPDAVEHCGELGAVAGLTGGEQQRQRSQAVFAGQMKFGFPSAPGPPECVIGRFAVVAAGWFGLAVAVAAGSGGVGVGTHDRGIHADQPSDLFGGVGDRLELPQHMRPDPGRRRGRAVGGHGR